MTTPLSPPTGQLRAWVDESGSVHALDPGTYLLAAAIGPTDLEDVIRQTMRTLRLPGQKKLHWRDENARRQRTIATAIAGLPQSHLVVVRAGDPSDTVKRRRNKCLERLLLELEGLAVTEVTFESRGAADDRRDLRLVQALRSQRALGTRVRIHHVPGPTEPLLWVPDAVCGAVTSARTTNPEHLDTLKNQINLIHI